MKLRNTTDFDTGAIRSLLRAVVREVEAALIGHHPKRTDAGAWSATDVQRRAAFILSHCDVWVRQKRSDERRDFAAEAQRYRDMGNEEHAARLDVVAEHGDSTGCASYSGRRLRMTLAGPSLVDFLWLARHETWHLFAVGHEDFPAAIMHETPSALAAVRDVYAELFARYGEQLPVAAVPVPKAKPTGEERAVLKLATIAAREKAWTTKLRRAQTALAKLKKSRSYYEKRVEQAAGKGKQPGGL